MSKAKNTLIAIMFHHRSSDDRNASQVSCNISVELILHKISRDGRRGDVVVPHVEFTEASAPIVGVVPQVGDGVRQPPAFCVIFIRLTVGERGAVAGAVLVLHRVEAHIRIAMVIQRIARRRHQRVRREEVAQRRVIPARAVVVEPQACLLPLPGEANARRRTFQCVAGDVGE